MQPDQSLHPNPSLQPSSAPNQPPSPTPYEDGSYPIDYLNQIAPAPRPQQINPKVLFGAIAGAVILVCIVAVLALGTNKPATVEQNSIALRERMTTLQKTTSQQQTDLKDITIRTNNATLTTYLASASSQLTDMLGPKAKPDKTTTATEKAKLTALKDKFYEANVAGTLDRTYAREITYEIDMLIVAIRRIYTASRSQDLKTFLDKTDTNLKVIRKSFADFIGNQ